jgi:hypothetical protein
MGRRQWRRPSYLEAQMHKGRKYSREEAARLLRANGLRTTAASLATMATRGGGPPYFKIGKHCFYLQIDLEIWLAKRSTCMLDSTSTPHGAKLDGFFDFGEEADDIETDIFNTCHPESDFHLRRAFEFERDLQIMIDNAGSKFDQQFI